MLLEIKNLEVSYGNVKALNGISLNVEKGKIISIIGANGAGKSTLLDSISGRVKKKAGEILFEGKVLPKDIHKIVQTGVTQVPEGRKIFADLSVEDNLIMGGISLPSAKTKATEKAMYELFPILDKRRQQQAGTLSGGEQQMLALARGLMSQPKLLLLDEPSLGLAPIIVNQVFSFIKEIRNMGYTILLVEQNATKALELCDYAYVLENGLVRMEGTAEELLSRSDIVSAYLGEKR
ncbi:MAG: ABC transporter ATP-binding protein [Clostridiaceae bacterium]